MSLILDALKKLDREKNASDPGVLVVGSVPWEGVRRHRLVAIVLVVLAIPAIAMGVYWLAQSRLRPAVSTVPAQADPAPLAAVPSRPAPQPGVPAGATPVVSPPAPRRLELPVAIEQRRPAAPATATEPIDVPAAEVAEPSPRRHELQLNAISGRDGQPVAVISGRLVREGDSWDGVTVLHISETEVEIEVAGERRTLRF